MFYFLKFVCITVKSTAMINDTEAFDSYTIKGAIMINDTDTYDDCFTHKPVPHITCTAVLTPCHHNMAPRKAIAK